MFLSLNMLNLDYKEYPLTICLNMIIFIFLLRLLIIFSSIIKFSKYYIKTTFNKKYYLIIIGLFLISIIMLLMNNSLFVLCLAWEGLGITSYLLVLFYYNWRRIQGRFLTIITSRFGDSFMLIFIVYSIDYCKTIRVLIVIRITFTKRAIFPFSSWLPAAMAAPTPVSSLVHSRTLVTAGLYLLFRFKAPWSRGQLKEFFILIGILTFLVGGFISIKCIDAKKIVAFSTLRQIGFILIIFYSLWVGLVIYQLLLHAFLKRFLFIRVGRIILSTNSQNFAFLSNIKQSFSFKFIYLIVLLNFIRIIFIRGFILKEIIILNFYFLSTLLKLRYFYFILVTAYYSYRFWGILFKKDFKIKLNFLLNLIRLKINYYIVIIWFRLLWNINLIYYRLRKTFIKILLVYCLIFLRIRYYSLNIWKYILMLNVVGCNLFFSVIKLKKEDLIINHLLLKVVYSFKYFSRKWRLIIISLLLVTLIYKRDF